MADNTVLNSGTGGDTSRSVQKGTPKTQVFIVDVGGGGSESLLAAGQATMAGSIPVVIASNQSAVPVSAGSLPLPTGAATETTLGTLNSKITACNTGAVAVSSLPVLPAGTNTVGQVGLVPVTSGGAAAAHVISAASTNATSVKASAGQLYGYAAFNTNAAWRYLKLYNKASAPTVGTDTPALVIGLPPGGGANLNLSNGIAFGTGIALAMTTGMADNDTGAVGATEVAVNVFYK